MTNVVSKAGLAVIYLLYQLNAQQQLRKIPLSSREENDRDMVRKFG